jgi:hypothetical protein
VRTCAYSFSPHLKEYKLRFFIPSGCTAQHQEFTATRDLFAGGASLINKSYIGCKRRRKEGEGERAKEKKETKKE